MRLMFIRRDDMSNAAIALGTTAVLLGTLLGSPAASWAAPRHLAAISNDSVATAPDQQGQGKAKGKDKGKAEAKKDKDDWKDYDRSRRLMLDYYQREGLPPGLAKRQSLPPGLQKQLRERGHLPPGLEKHLVLLPPQLVRTLPPLPPHCEHRLLGDDLLIIDFSLNLIVGIVSGVLPQR
jgi:hypothetical protein